MSGTKLARVAEAAVAFARSEIANYGLPHPIAFDLSIEKGRWLAGQMGACAELVEIGVSLMDVKLGEAFKAKRLGEHIRMSAQAADEFLHTHNVTEDERKIIINAVEAHHGTIGFIAPEAEICANADCYRFIHPKGFFLYLTVLGKRLADFSECLTQAESKLDEKMQIVSLPLVKSELTPIYDTLKGYIRLARP